YSGVKKGFFINATHLMLQNNLKSIKLRIEEYSKIIYENPPSTIIKLIYLALLPIILHITLEFLVFNNGETPSFSIISCIIYFACNLFVINSLDYHLLIHS